MFKKILLESIRFLLILLFVYAAAIKLLEYHKFIVQIGLSPLLPAFLYKVAWIIPVVELLTAIALLFQKTLRPGLYASLCIMFIFTLYIVGIFTVADHIPCSCGGILESLSWTDHLIFNIAFLLLCIGGLILTRDEREVHQQATVTYRS